MGWVRVMAEANSPISEGGMPAAGRMLRGVVETMFVILLWVLGAEERGNSNA